MTPEQVKDVQDNIDAMSRYMWAHPEEYKPFIAADYPLDEQTVLNVSLTVDADGYLVKAIADVNKTQLLDTAAELAALKNELTRLRTEFAIFREKVERRIIKEYFAGLTS